VIEKIDTTSASLSEQKDFRGKKLLKCTVKKMCHQTLLCSACASMGVFAFTLGILQLIATASALGIVNA
jgi:hypothetical protein